MSSNKLQRLYPTQTQLTDLQLHIFQNTNGCKIEKKQHCVTFTSFKPTVSLLKVNK